MGGRNKTDQGRSLEEARAAKKPAQDIFERLGQTAAIGITRSGTGYGLKINLQQAFPKNMEVPEEIEGVPIKIEVVGPVRKRGA